MFEFIAIKFNFRKSSSIKYIYAYLELQNKINENALITGRILQ